MSEFGCENGHQSKAGLRCSVCGGKITTMDGKGNRELMAEYDDELYKDDDEEDE